MEKSDQSTKPDGIDKHAEPQLYPEMFGYSGHDLMKMNVFDHLGEESTGDVSEDVAKKLLAWAFYTELMPNFFTPPAKAAAVPRVYETVATKFPEAWLKLAAWYTRGCEKFMMDTPDRMGLADKALREAVSREVPGSKLELANHRWHWRRLDCSDEEKKEAFGYVSEVVEKEPENAEAHFLKGHLLCAGYGTPMAKEEAFRHQKIAAGLGLRDADFELSIYCTNGFGTEVNPSMGFQHLLAAAEKEHPRALFNVGAAYFSGNDVVDRDVNEAIRWYEKARNQGHIRSILCLADIYSSSEHVEKDFAYVASILDEAEDMYGVDVEEYRAMFLPNGKP